jgi:hypothetical protein
MFLSFIAFHGFATFWKISEVGLKIDQDDLAILLSQPTGRSK